MLHGSGGVLVHGEERARQRAVRSSTGAHLPAGGRAVGQVHVHLHGRPGGLEEGGGAVHPVLHPQQRQVRPQGHLADAVRVEVELVLFDLREMLRHSQQVLQRLQGAWGQIGPESCSDIDIHAARRGQSQNGTEMHSIRPDSWLV